MAVSIVDIENTPIRRASGSPGCNGSRPKTNYGFTIHEDGLCLGCPLDELGKDVVDKSFRRFSVIL